MSGRNLKELNKLEEILKEHGILYERIDTGDRYKTPERAIDFHQIRACSPGGYKWDVVCHYGSFGAEEGLLEGMGAPFGADVEGYMTADDVIDRIKPFYKGMI